MSSEATSTHADQNIPREWTAIDVDGRTLIVHDPEANGADAYLLTMTSRNVRTFARADAALYEGNVVEPVYDEDTRTVEFVHHWAGRVGRKSVAEFFDEPAARLKRVPEMEESEVTLTVNANETTISVSEGEADYEMKYIDPDKIRDADEDKLWEPTAHILARGSHLKRAVTLATEAGDVIAIEYNSDEEILSIRNEDDVDTGGADIPVDDTIENEDGSALYSDDYLVDVFEAIRPVSQVAVKLGDEVPVEFQVASGGVESQFAIAPRITGVDD